MFDYKDLIERLLSKNNKLLYGKHNFFISSSMLWVKNYINSLPMKTNKSKNKNLQVMPSEIKKKSVYK